MHDFVDYNIPMMPCGIHDETGYPLYLLSRQRFGVVIPQCKCCGTTNVISVPLGKGQIDMCYECGNRLQSFKMSKCRLNKWSSVKSYNTFVDKIQGLDGWNTLIAKITNNPTNVTIEDRVYKSGLITVDYTGIIWPLIVE